MKDLEERRRSYLQRIKELFSDRFDPERWAALKRLTYSTVQLNLDVVIDDSTLREGLQMAGLAQPHPEDVCEIGCLLRDLGVERIEVLAYTKTDQQAIQLMKDKGLRKMLAGWCRAAKEDIDLMLQLDLEQVGISHPVSFIHFEKWPEVTLEKLLERATSAVEYARSHGLRVFVHGEDSTRADWKFEKEFINAVAVAGAEVYRICDTVGCGVSDLNFPLPQGIPAKVRAIKNETKIPYVEIHAHDDLGNAVENTMAAIRAASGLYDKVYASTTMLGIGERAGNAETEKVIMNCYMHHGIEKWNLSILKDIASFFTSSIDYRLPVNKAIVGDAAFAHESGIHVYGIKTLPLTYEIFPPELVGQERTIAIGKRSGKHGIKLKLEQILEREVPEDDKRLEQLVDLVKKKFVEGRRRYPLRDEEFKALARRVGFEVE